MRRIRLLMVALVMAAAAISAQGVLTQAFADPPQSKLP